MTEACKAGLSEHGVPECVGSENLAAVEGDFKYTYLYLLNENPLNLTPKPWTLLFLSTHTHPPGGLGQIKTRLR